MSSVHVVIVNYNSSAYLADCIRSLRPHPVDRIVVVDNASRTDDREAASAIAASDGRVALLLSPENAGFAAGVNRGVQHLDPRDEDVVVVLNPDTRVAPGALTALAEAVSGGRFDVVNPVIYTGDPEQPVVWFAGGRVDRRRGETAHIGFASPGPVACTDREISFVTGAALAMTARTWRELGGLREDLFLYWEDADLSLRAAADGKRLGLVGDAAVWHAEGGSGDDGGHSVAFHYYMQRNRILVLRPVTGLRRLVAGSGSRTLLRNLVRALQEPSGRVAKAASSVLGVYDGIRGRTGRPRRVRRP